MEANPVKIMRLPSISIKENQDSDTKCYISIKTVFFLHVLQSDTV